jgi:hypothetical protein
VGLAVDVAEEVGGTVVAVGVRLGMAVGRKRGPDGGGSICVKVWTGAATAGAAGARVGEAAIAMGINAEGAGAITRAGVAVGAVRAPPLLVVDVPLPVMGVNPSAGAATTAVDSGKGVTPPVRSGVVVGSKVLAVANASGSASVVPPAAS